MTYIMDVNTQQFLSELLMIPVPEIKTATTHCLQLKEADMKRSHFSM
jgi:hypothetical protein